MTVPASSPVDDALDRLHRSSADYIDRTIATVRNHRGADNCWPQWANIFADEIEDLRADVERLREERDAAWAAFNNAEDAHDDTKQKLWRDRGLMLDLQQRVESAEAEVRRLTEGLRERDELLARILDHGAAGYAEHQARWSAWVSRSASPSDGGGAK